MFQILTIISVAFLLPFTWRGVLHIICTAFRIVHAINIMSSICITSCYRHTTSSISFMSFNFSATDSPGKIRQARISISSNRNQDSPYKRHLRRPARMKKEQSKSQSNKDWTAFMSLPCRYTLSSKCMKLPFCLCKGDQTVSKGAGGTDGQSVEATGVTVR